MLKYIKNLDIILADIKKANITIARIKSQFCYFDIKILSYICDFERQHPNILKVLKNFDQLKYMSVTIV